MPIKSRAFRVLELNAEAAPVFHSLAERHPLRGKIIYHGVDSDPAFRPLFGYKPARGLRAYWHQTSNEEFLRNVKRAPDNYFDEVHAHMPEPELQYLDLLEQVHRVLRPGGLFFILDQGLNRKRGAFGLAATIGRHNK